MFRVPVNLLIVPEHLFADSGGADEPGLARVIEQRCIAPPTERVLVLIFACLQQQPARGKVFGDPRVGFFHEFACPRFYFRYKRSIWGHQLHQG